MKPNAYGKECVGWISSELAMSGDPLGRYYTEGRVGHLVVSLFDLRRANSILDLGAGGGSLSLAAAQRWGEAQILTIDADCGVRDLLRSRMSLAGHRLHEHLVADAFDENLPDLIRGARFDLAVCNPPYSRIRWRDGFAKILSDAGLADLHTLVPNAVTSEIVFVAQILRLAHPGAEIGVIVPDGFVSGRRAQLIRRAFLHRTQVARVVQLPRGSFRGTDAQAHIIVFRNQSGEDKNIELSKLTPHGLSAPLLISTIEAEQRMDHAYYERQTQSYLRKFTLRSIGAEIVRGSLSSSEARICPFPIFHTTSFSQYDPYNYHLPTYDISSNQTKCRMAEIGDILLARVDRELHRKICLIVQGKAVITDCVYRIRVSPNWRQSVSRALLSPHGQSELIRASRGVGARMLNKEDLLNMELEAI